MKNSLEFVFTVSLLITGFAWSAAAQGSGNRCRVGQSLICIPVICGPGYAGNFCRENPPPPKCFCANDPDPAPQEGGQNECETNSK